MNIIMYVIKLLKSTALYGDVASNITLKHKIFLTKRNVLLVSNKQLNISKFIGAILNEKWQ